MMLTRFSLLSFFRYFHIGTIWVKNNIGYIQITSTWYMQIHHPDFNYFSESMNFQPDTKLNPRSPCTDSTIPQVSFQRSYEFNITSSTHRIFFQNALSFPAQSRSVEGGTSATPAAQWARYSPGKPWGTPLCYLGRWSKKVEIFHVLCH